MAIVYRTSDRLRVKVGELVVVIGPLNRYQKAKVQSLIVEDKMYDSAAEALKGSIKGIEGLETVDGGQYQLQFDDNKELTDECLDDLLNLDVAGELTVMAVSLLNGIPKEFTNPATGKKLKGVEYVEEGESTKK
jgi:hypothetical protein